MTHTIGGMSRDTLTKGGKVIIAGDRLILQNDYGSILVAQLTGNEPELLARSTNATKAGKKTGQPLCSPMVDSTAEAVATTTSRFDLSSGTGID